MQVPRFYPILDTETALRHEISVADAAAQMLDAGARILQFRQKGFFLRDVLVELERIAKLCEQASAQLVVNDRADVALLVGAALHLGQDDLTPSQARIVGGAEMRIGYSTHNEKQLRAALAEPTNYLAIGPIFGTSTKKNPDPVVGLDELRRLRPLTDKPLVAIGGITRSNARAVIDAGADSVAVIGDLFPDVRTRTAEFIAIVS